MLASSGEITAPCPVPLSLTITIPSSMTPALSHLRIRRMMRRSPLHEPDEPFLVHRVEERLNVGVQYEAHLLAVDCDAERIQRIVRAAFRPESIRDAEEVFLVDRVPRWTRSCRSSMLLSRSAS